MNSRQTSIDCSQTYFDSGEFLRDLARLISRPTESQEPTRAAELQSYLRAAIAPTFSDMGFSYTTYDNPVARRDPIILAQRIESESLPTVLGYWHGDVVRGMDDRWGHDRSPWDLHVEENCWYGRGTADNSAALGEH